MTDTRCVRVLIVDDHPIVRRSLSELLGNCGPAMQVVAQAASAEEALQLAAQCQPDIVLTDLNMKPTSGVELIRQLGQHHPAMRCVVFTASTQDEHMLQAFDAGAHGFVVKESEAGELVSAIGAVAGEDVEEFVLAVGGHHHEGRNVVEIGVGADTLDGRESIQAGHHPVHQDQSVGLACSLRLFKRGNSFAATVHGMCVEFLCAQYGHHDFAGPGVVVDHQYP